MFLQADKDKDGLVSGTLVMSFLFSYNIVICDIVDLKGLPFLASVCVTHCFHINFSRIFCMLLAQSKSK